MIRLLPSKKSRGLQVQIKMEKTYMGWDNGIAGGLSFYRPSTGELWVYPMPIITVKKLKGNKNMYDIPRIIELIRFHDGICMAVLERAQAFPGSSVQATFSFARTFGIAEGILSALGIPYMIVSPQSWMAKMFEGISHKKGESKQASVLVAQRLFPNTKFVPSDKAKKIHDGMTDATLMAVYASKQ